MKLPKQIGRKRPSSNSNKKIVSNKNKASSYS